MKKSHTHIIFGLAALGAIVLAFVISGMLKPPRAAHASYNGYNFFRTIEVTPNTAIASGTNINFPMLFSGTYSWLAASSSGGTLQNSNGYDFIFATSTACAPSLNFEVESYNTINGAVNAWVQVPTLSPGTVIYICYDNSAITTSQGSANGTWDSHYAGVYHLPNSVSLTANDSTDNGNNGTVLDGGTTAGAGQIGGGAIFNGATNAIDIGSSTSLGPTSAITLEAWVNSASLPTGTMQYIMAKDGGSACSYYADSDSWYLCYYNDDLNNYLEVGSVKYSTSAFANYMVTLTPGTWYQVVGTFDGTRWNLYLDGALASTSSIDDGSANSCSVVSDTSNLVYGSGPVYINNPYTASWINTTSLVNGSSASLVARPYNPAWTAFIPDASWIWVTSATTNPTVNEAYTFVKTFAINGTSTDAMLDINADNSYSVAVNGNAVASNPNEDNYSSATEGQFDITSALHNGTNTISITVANFGDPNSSSTSNPAGLLYKLVMQGVDCGAGGGGPQYSNADALLGDGHLTNSSTSWNGSIDEARISSIARSPSWILTQYNNQLSPSTFYTIGAPDVFPIDTWIATSSNSWSVPTNWSMDVVPNSSDIALFSSSSTLNSMIDSPANVIGLSIVSGYTGTISQNSGKPITIGQIGFSQADGTFTGSSDSDTIAINGPFSFTSGTTFQSTAGSLYLYASSTFAGTFNDNSGQVVIAARSSPSLITGSATFYKLALGDGSENDVFVNVATGTVLTATNDLTFEYNNSMIHFGGGGEIDAEGNILNIMSSINTSIIPTSTFNFVINGTGTQFLNGGATGFYFPNLTVNKASGVAYLISSSTTVTGNLTVSGGEFQLASSSAQQFVINGSTVVTSSAVFSDYPNASSSIAFGGPVTNNTGVIFFDGSGLGCAASSSSYLTLNSTTTGSPIAWSGSGDDILRYLNVADQAGTAYLSVVNGTKIGSDVGTNWNFTTAPEAELLQQASGTGLTYVPLSPFGFRPRAGDLLVVAISARNQTIMAPTDNASNTYTLITAPTFGSSPSYALSLYYAKNILTTSSLTITAQGGGGSSPYLSAVAYDYTGMDPSSTFDSYTANTVGSGGGTSLTSFSDANTSAGELYFGASTFSAITSATPGSGWTQESGLANNVSTQGLYTEDITATSSLNTAATWTAGTSTNYIAVMATFHAPYQQDYVPVGTLDSTTFDTGVASGTQLNSFVWQGSAPSNSSVKFQFAVSNSPTGPWSFEGPDGTANTYFSGLVGSPISLLSTTKGYTLFAGYRYFRYRVTLFPDSSYAHTPTVTQVSVNWSP